ncbi:uncharacterized protein [Triticum aestivum]|uniref:uncharacterized protein n=1 Tax=Triticum aestivum TaxID=4565 RepID=UPI001D01AF65|nr:uncharacterized protein LOC123055827 [Triticum aestivum]
MRRTRNGLDKNNNSNERPDKATSKLATLQSNDNQPDIIRAAMKDAARKRKEILQQKRNQDSLAALNLRRSNGGPNQNNRSNILGDQTIQIPEQGTSQLATVESNDSQSDIIRAARKEARRKRKEILQLKRERKRIRTEKDNNGCEVSNIAKDVTQVSNLGKPNCDYCINFNGE